MTRSTSFITHFRAKIASTVARSENYSVHAKWFAIHFPITNPTMNYAWLYPFGTASKTPLLLPNVRICRSRGVTTIQIEQMCRRKKVTVMKYRSSRRNKFVGRVGCACRGDNTRREIVRQLHRNRIRLIKWGRLISNCLYARRWARRDWRVVPRWFIRHDGSQMFDWYATRVIIIP